MQREMLAASHNHTPQFQEWFDLLGIGFLWGGAEPSKR